MSNTLLVGVFSKEYRETTFFINASIMDPESIEKIIEMGVLPMRISTHGKTTLDVEIYIPGIAVNTVNWPVEGIVTRKGSTWNIIDGERVRTERFSLNKANKGKILDYLKGVGNHVLRAISNKASATQRELLKDVHPAVIWNFRNSADLIDNHSTPEQIKERLEAYETATTLLEDEFINVLQERRPYLIFDSL